MGNLEKKRLGAFLSLIIKAWFSNFMTGFLPGVDWLTIVLKPLAAAF